MKKSNKSIIIGISSMFLITLLLVGLTYAYYRTRVIGNDSPTTIVTKGEKLEIVYTDGTAWFTPGKTGSSQQMNGIEQGEIEPGDSFTKEFTVTNNSDRELTFGVTLDNITNEFTRIEDWKWTLEETSGTFKETGIVPVSDSYIVGSINIAAKETKTYKLILLYQNVNEDQGDDMGAKLSLRVNIANEIDGMFKNAAQGTLLKTIGMNNFISNPVTTPGHYISDPNEAVFAKTADSIGSTEVDGKTIDGITYYFRGNVKNNYATFNDMCWRIVRVQGDGSIKLILADGQTGCSAKTDDNSVNAVIHKWYYGNKDYQPKSAGYGFEELSTGEKIGKYFLSYQSAYLTDDETGKTNVKKEGKDISLAVQNNFIADTLYDWMYDADPQKTGKFSNKESRPDGTKIGFDDVELTKIKLENWCLGDTQNAYDSNGNNLGPIVLENTVDGTTTKSYNLSDLTFTYETLNRLGKYNENATATLKCNGETFESKIGTLTADEVTFAGARNGSSNPNFYLYNSKIRWGIMSLGSYSSKTSKSFSIDMGGRLAVSHAVNANYNYVRPAIVLNNDVTITSGTGTKANPYVIDASE